MNQKMSAAAASADPAVVDPHVVRLARKRAERMTAEKRLLELVEYGDDEAVLSQAKVAKQLGADQHQLKTVISRWELMKQRAVVLLDALETRLSI